VCAANVLICDTQEGPGEMQNVTAFDMVSANMCGRLYVYLDSGWTGGCEGRGVMAGDARYEG
jgi:hypothetical protein